MGLKVYRGTQELMEQKERLHALAGSEPPAGRGSRMRRTSPQKVVIAYCLPALTIVAAAIGLFWRLSAAPAATGPLAVASKAPDAAESRHSKGTTAGPRIVTETFDSAASAASHGWTGNGNTAYGHAFGWSSTGVGTGGAAGGIFARSRSFSTFADTRIGTFDRTSTLRLAGSFRLANVNFDGYLRLGYFTPGGGGGDFVGLMIIEPSGAAGSPFRAYVGIGVGGAGGAGIVDAISLPQNTTLTFDLTWTGSADGSGTLIGTLAGQSVSVTAGPGRNTFTAFGLLCGGSGRDDANQKTAGCYFDNLAYSKAGNRDVDE